MSGGWSLRGRLQRRVLIAIGFSWCIGLVLAISALKHEMGELVDESLKATAGFVLAIQRDSGTLNLPERGSGIEIRVVQDGHEISTADWPALSSDGGHDLPGWRVYRRTDRETGTVVEVGQNNKWRRQELGESVAWLIAIMLPVLLIVLFVIRHIVASALKEADLFARSLQSRKPGDMRPLEAPDLPKELVPIRDSMNFYLDRIRDYVEAEAQFATHAAHELRTPVAAASAQAQALAAGVAEPGAARRIADALQRLGQLVDRLLQLSRADAAGAGMAESDLVQITRMVIADLPGDIVFDDGDVESATVGVQPEALALILGNLIRNARDHGSGRVRVVLDAGPSLTISNPTAPGAAFRHGTFEKSAQSAGTGLGLAIVHKIAGKEGVTLGFALEDGIAKVVLQFRSASEFPKG